jgi:acyl-CoA synthetase (AMP-forming)/AMP-acid ligase II
MMNLAEALAHHKGSRPSHPALIAGDRQILYRDLYPLVTRTAAHLGACGIAPGDLVGLTLKDTLEHVVLFYALARLGVVNLPMDWRWTLEERAGVAGRFGARCVLVEPGAEITGVRCIAIDDSWHQAVARATEDGAYPGGGDLPLLVSLSSGTTGRPKGPLLTHGQFFRRFMVHWINLNLNSLDRYVSATPLYFGGGRTFVMSVLFAGGTVILFPPPYQPRDLVAELSRRQATSLFLVPTLLRRMLELPHGDAAAFRSLRLLLSSGSALHPDERREIRSRLSANFFEYYASTEGGGVSLLTPQDQMIHADSVGRPVFGAEVEVVDDDHQLVAPGTVGRLRYRGPAVATGFFGECDPDRETFRDGWFYPGDLACLDKDGYVFLRGRRKDVIIRGGVNIYPGDIEAALLAHPMVAEAAVVGLPDREFGEEVAAFVMLRDRVAAAELVAWCRERLAAYKVPKSIIRLDEMPRNSAGKIVKRELIERAALTGRRTDEIV